MKIKTYFLVAWQRIKERLDARSFKFLSDKQKEDVYIEALKNNDIKTMNVLKSYGYDLQKTIEHNIHLVSLHPLLVCAQYGAKSSFDFLLSERVDINTVDMNGKNALMYAILFLSPKDSSFIDFLLQRGINIHHRDFDFKNALCYIKRAESPHLLFETLKKSGADVRQEIEKGKNFIDLLVNFIHFNTKHKPNNKEFVKLECYEKILLSLLPELHEEETKKFVDRFQTRRILLPEHIKTVLLSHYEKLMFAHCITAPTVSQAQKKRNKI